MNIAHIVMLRLTPGFVTDEYFAYTEDIFARLREAVDGILAVSCHRNCVAREGNYDLMIRLELADASVLPVYLAHPLHLEFARSNGDQLLSRASFDYPI